MKKLCFIGVSAICALAAVSIMLPASAASSYIRGDANGDGHVTVKDVTMVQKVLAYAESDAEGIVKRNCDFDGNGLGITDATKIQQYLAGYNNTYNIGEAVMPDPSFNPYELPFIPG